MWLGPAAAAASAASFPGPQTLLHFLRPGLLVLPIQAFLFSLPRQAHRGRRPCWRSHTELDAAHAAPRCRLQQPPMPPASLSHFAASRGLRRAWAAGCGGRGVRVRRRRECGHGLRARSARSAPARPYLLLLHCWEVSGCIRLLTRRLRVCRHPAGGPAHNVLDAKFQRRTPQCSIASVEGQMPHCAQCLRLSKAASTKCSWNLRLPYSTLSQRLEHHHDVKFSLTLGSQLHRASVTASNSSSYALARLRLKPRLLRGPG